VCSAPFPGRYPIADANHESPSPCVPSTTWSPPRLLESEAWLELDARGCCIDGTLRRWPASCTLRRGLKVPERALLALSGRKGAWRSALEARPSSAPAPAEHFLLTHHALSAHASATLQLQAHARTRAPAVTGRPRPSLPPRARTPRPRLHGPPRAHLRLGAVLCWPLCPEQTCVASLDRPGPYRPLLRPRPPPPPLQRRARARARAAASESASPASRACGRQTRARSPRSSRNSGR
jgi:hypothetical protein